MYISFKYIRKMDRINSIFARINYIFDSCSVVNLRFAHDKKWFLGYFFMSKSYILLHKSMEIISWGRLEFCVILRMFVLIGKSGDNSLGVCHALLSSCKKTFRDAESGIANQGLADKKTLIGHTVKIECWTFLAYIWNSIT